MTAEEALASIIRNHYPSAPDIAAKHLRALGYVIIPVTPRGETIERLVKTAYPGVAFGKLGQQDYSLEFANVIHKKGVERMRAAYAAIVGGEG